MTTTALTTAAMRQYFMLVSDQNEEFANKMVEHTINESAGRKSYTLKGKDVLKIARETGAYISRYFYPGDLEVFEMDVHRHPITKDIVGVVVHDSPRGYRVIA